MITEWIMKQRATDALRQVFKTGEIGISYDYSNSDGMIYPKIRRVKFDKKNQTISYSFSLPMGLDPKEIMKKEYCFKQMFGDNIQLTGGVKEFKLLVFFESLTNEFLYDHEQFQAFYDKKRLILPIITGITHNKELVAYDMRTQPHLLIAGETGSGKSTQLRSILTSLIQTCSPKKLQLYLCDLKRSEFFLFRRVPHVKGVYNSVSDMVPMLRHIKQETIRRGNLLDKNEVAHIDDLEHPPPYIILCIDEFALLKSEKEIWTFIEEISSIGRALGIFLILSVLRPDRDVMDGKIKNNLTVRMGFRCSNLTNARIVDTPGAEKIKVTGRMLLKSSSFEDLQEVQGPYLTLERAKETLEPYKVIKGESEPNEDLLSYTEAKETVELQENIFGVLDDEATR